jgi:2-iminobutanoate/2-iminopropanoate deaminase
MHRSLANLERILAAAELALEDVVQVRAYVAEATDLPEYNAIYCEYFSEPFPARTTLTSCLVGLKFEIDAIAVHRTVA